MPEPQEVRNGPLAGVRIIEMAALGPVPFCGMLMADLGAEVILIERANSAPPGEPIPEQFNFLGRGRRSITLDLKNPQAVEIVLKLATTAEIIMEGMRPGAMERLGLGPKDCLARNPRLIYSRMTGWGQTGPLAQRAGHDINYISLNGVLDAVGSAGGPPVPPVNLVGDYGGGSMFLLVGILAALLEARTSGQGQVIDAAMLEGSSYLMSSLHMFRVAGHWSGGRGGNFLDGGAPYYAVYETADGKYMSVGAIEPKFYDEFIAGLGLDAAALPQPQDATRWAELKLIFGQTFRSKTRVEWEEIFSQRDACVTPVLTMEESLQHPHNQQRQSFVHSGGAARPNLAPRFSKMESGPIPTSAHTGFQAREILQELEFSEQQIDQLIRQKAVICPGSSPS